MLKHIPLLQGEHMPDLHDINPRAVIKLIMPAVFGTGHEMIR